MAMREPAANGGSPPDELPPTNLRRHRSATERRLVAGGVAAAFLVGGALIWYFWDLGAMLTSWLCLLGALLPIGAVYLVLKLAEWGGRAGPDA